MQAGFLFELAIKATFVIAATWALARILSRASAAARSAVWACGLDVRPGAAACMAVVPSWSTRRTFPSPRCGAPSEPSSRTLGSMNRRRREPPQSSLVFSTGREPNARASPRCRGRRGRRIDRSSSIVWLLGTFVALVRLGSWAAARSGRSRKPPYPLRGSRVDRHRRGRLCPSRPAACHPGSGSPPVLTVPAVDWRSEPDAAAARGLPHLVRLVPPRRRAPRARAPPSARLPDPVACRLRVRDVLVPSARPRRGLASSPRARTGL